MQRRHLYAAVVILGVSVTIASAIALLSVQVASAQCGSQASSCKNCHETQAKDPVNNDGTGWHQSHAFGDFCYICHAGNSQSLDKTAAHTGMVDPMADVQTACAQCHPNELQARVDVYAAKLGTTVNAAASPAAAPSASPTEAAGSVTAATAAVPASVAQPTLAAGDPNLVDYVQRYNQQVLHQEPTNWGNIVLIALVVLLILAGIFIVNRREGWISVSFTEKKPLEKSLPADVAGIATQVAQMKPAARKSLSRLLARPAAGDLLSALDEFSAGTAPKDEDEGIQ